MRPDSGLSGIWLRWLRSPGNNSNNAANVNNNDNVNRNGNNVNNNNNAARPDLHQSARNRCHGTTVSADAKEPYSIPGH